MQTDRVQTKLAPQFLPVIRLTPEIQEAIKAGSLPLRTGQWVEDQFGSRGQFLRVRNGAMFVTWVHPSEGFTHRTQRFARAVWHHKRKSDPVTAIVGAPRSLSFDMVKDWFRRKFVGA